MHGATTTTTTTKSVLFFTSNIRRIMNVIFFVSADSPTSEFYAPSFRNTLSHLPSCSHHLWKCNRQGVPKRRHIQFRRRGISQKEEYNSHPFLCMFNREVFRGFLRNKK
jgi:hypothetical protein